MVKSFSVCLCLMESLLGQTEELNICRQLLTLWAFSSLKKKKTENEKGLPERQNLPGLCIVLLVNVGCSLQREQKTSSKAKSSVTVCN